MSLSRRRAPLGISFERRSLAKLWFYGDEKKLDINWKITSFIGKSTINKPFSIANYNKLPESIGWWFHISSVQPQFEKVILNAFHSFGEMIDGKDNSVQHVSHIFASQTNATWHQAEYHGAPRVVKICPRPWQQGAHWTGLGSSKNPSIKAQQKMIDTMIIIYY